VLHTLQVDNHGEPLVCSAVSALVLNTINSIEALTAEPFDLSYKEDGGFIRLHMPYRRKSPKMADSGATLLLASLLLGLEGILAEHPKNIKICYDD